MLGDQFAARRRRDQRVNRKPATLVTPAVRWPVPFYFTMQARAPLPRSDNSAISEFKSKTQSADAARRSDLSARPKARQSQRGPAPQRTDHTMSSNATILRRKASLQNLIDQVINAGLLVLVGCSI